MTDAAALALERARELAARFARIATADMAGIPLLHPGLAVRALGFAPDESGTGACGVLVTPWFMNLVWLPLAAGSGAAAGDDSAARPPPAAPLAPGAMRERRVGNERFTFIGACDDVLGPYEACSLFSPMFEFADQAAAEATAQAVLDALRAPPPAPAVDGGRRAMLFGRRAGAAA
jgi:[NiFe] hydrogenase assembly HybE family chaperone